MLPENIVQLALKSRKEGLTVKEREFLDQWLLENVELQEEFHQLVECGSVVQAARLFEDIQIRDAWQNMEQKLYPSFHHKPSGPRRLLCFYPDHSGLLPGNRNHRFQGRDCPHCHVSVDHSVSSDCGLSFGQF